MSGGAAARGVGLGRSARFQSIQDSKRFKFWETPCVKSLCRQGLSHRRAESPPRRQGQECLMTMFGDTYYVPQASFSTPYIWGSLWFRMCAIIIIELPLEKKISTKKMSGTKRLLQAPVSGTSRRDRF